MIKTQTLTFHAPHNYGSMLQAYALQRSIISLGVSNVIINYRSYAQKKQYTPLHRHSINNLKDFIRVLFFSLYSRRLNKKYALFEDFLQKNLLLTEEINLDKEFEQLLIDTDCLIVGSDQVWNTSCIDFSWLYYLPCKGIKKVAYAPSMGPMAKDEISPRYYKEMKECLLDFDVISVREPATLSAVQEISGKQAVLMPDPTFLISREEWLSHINKEPIVKGDYILLYTPNRNPSIIGEICDYFSKELKMPVVITQLDWQNTWYFMDSSVKLKLDVGPWEFLNLLNNSRLVLSFSFHAVAFSLLFHKPFFAIDGQNDSRIAPLLEHCMLAERCLKPKDLGSKVQSSFNLDFTTADRYLANQRNKGFDFLKASILEMKPTLK